VDGEVEAVQSEEVEEVREVLLEEGVASVLLEEAVPEVVEASREGAGLLQEEEAAQGVGLLHADVVKYLASLLV